MYAVCGKNYCNSAILPYSVPGEPHFGRKRASKEKQTICAILQNKMPLKTPASPSKSSGKPTGKTVTPAPARGKDKAAPATKKKAAAPPPPPPVTPTWWESLTDERKLDVVGAIMAVVGTLTILILVSSQNSPLTGSISPPSMTSTGPSSRTRMTLPVPMRAKCSLFRHVQRQLAVQRVSAFLQLRLRY